MESATGMKIYSHLYRNKYRSVINLSYVADTMETHMAGSMKHPITVFFPGYINKETYLGKNNYGRTKTVHVLSEQLCWNNYGQRGVKILPPSKTLLSLRFQSYQYDKGKTFVLFWDIFNKLLNSCQVHTHQLTVWLVSSKPCLSLTQIIVAVWGEDPYWISLSFFLTHWA